MNLDRVTDNSIQLIITLPLGLIASEEERGVSPFLLKKLIGL